jgi:dephospho-CoA kinase
MTEVNKTKVGLTGDIGSGKSTVLGLFKELGFATASADALVHELLASDGGLISSICRHFGKDALNADGGIDRKKLGSKVFADAQQRKHLEELIHPLVRREWERFIEQSSAPACIVEIPLLFEKSLEKRFTYSVSIFCSFEVKLRRLQSRGLSESAVKRRLDAQMCQTDKLNRADFLILNNGSLNYLRYQVEHCAELMLNR